MEPSEIKSIAQARLEGRRGRSVEFAPERAYGTVDVDFGRTILIPTQTAPVKGLEELTDGAVIGALSIEFSATPTRLKDGVYDIFLRRDNSTWVAELSNDDGVAYTTTNVYVTESPLDAGIEPFGVVFGFGVEPLTMFFMGMVVGMLIA